MATSAPRSRAAMVAAGLYAAGGLLLAGEAAVHVQQFFALFHAVAWIGPLFLANAAACAVAIAGLASRRARPLAAFAGVAISAAALGALTLSYAVGIFGWTEAGLRTPIALAMASEAGAVVALGAALAVDAAAARRSLQDRLARRERAGPDHRKLRSASAL